MKTLLLIAAVTITATTFAQTSVISIKSRQGDLAGIPQSSDHFGMVEPAPVYDTLIKIDDHCVIQIGSRGWVENRFHDTVCQHWYYEQNNYDVKKIKEYHGKNVVLIGFEKDQSQVTPRRGAFHSRTRHLSAEWIVILLGLIALGTYVGAPFRTSKK